MESTLDPFAKPGLHKGKRQEGELSAAANGKAVCGVGVYYRIRYDKEM